MYILLFAAMLGAADAPAPRCQYANMGAVQLGFSGNNLEPTIPATLNGRPTTMLFDTGAYATSILRRTVDELDLPTRATREQAFGVGGKAELYQVELKEFSVGPSRNMKGFFRVMEDHGNHSSWTGLVGRDYIFQADVEIQLAESKVNFLRPVQCGPNDFLAYWDPNAVVVPLEEDLEHSDAPVIKLLINGKPVLALLDTGATSTVLDIGAAKELGITPESAGAKPGPSHSGIGPDLVKAWQVPVASIAIGDELIQNTKLTIADLGMNSSRHNAVMLLGADFIRAHRMLFAVSQQKLYLSYLGGDPFGAGVQQRLPFIEREAKAGNADAIYQLARHYFAGTPTPRDPERASGLLKQALALGQYDAVKNEGWTHFFAGEYSAAQPFLLKASNSASADLYDVLWAYLAQARSGELNAARSALQNRRDLPKRHDWPYVLHDYLLGKADAAALQKEVRREPGSIQERDCIASFYQGQHMLLQQQSGQARSYFEHAAKACPAAYVEAMASQAELTLMSKKAP